GVPYAEAKEVVGTGGAEALTSRWEVRWTPATAQTLMLLAAFLVLGLLLLPSTVSRLVGARSRTDAGAHRDGDGTKGDSW
ncbi:hypothetical protein, partial [Streptomyces sp. NPDC001508]|uniref:hypothetical protein n=1 Tax=Streptomyces sp. NPDC001508 TaxID=3154656 RepID=UPI00331BB21E